jgi:hypothetical protein
MLSFSVSGGGLFRSNLSTRVFSHAFLSHSCTAGFAVARPSVLPLVVYAKVINWLRNTSESTFFVIANYCFHDNDYITRKECVL